MTIHTAAATEITIFLLLCDEPFDCLLNGALELAGGLVTDSPTVEAKQGGAGAGRLVITIAAMLFNVPASIGLLIAATLASSSWTNRLLVVSLTSAWRLVLIGLFFNQSLPSVVGGDAVRAYECSRIGIRVATAV